MSVHMAGRGKLGWVLLSLGCLSLWWIFLHGMSSDDFYNRTGQLTVHSGTGEHQQISVTEEHLSLAEILRREQVVLEKEALLDQRQREIEDLEKNRNLRPITPSASVPDTQSSPVAQVVPALSKSLEVSGSANGHTDVISYVYVETASARRNLQFFIQHGLYDSADFIFTFNGETNAYEMLPNHPKSPWYDPKIKNIEVIHRDNTCLDFGGHGEALLREWSDDGKTLHPMGKQHNGGKRFLESYKRYILMNASVRGPFLPVWSNECWSEAYWSRLTDKIKLAGMSYNCHSGGGHAQSMVWATDRVGLEVMFQHPIAGVGGGIGYWCPIDMVDAIYGETRTTPLLYKAGYDVDVMTLVYHSRDGDDIDGDGFPDNSPKNYIAGCTTNDLNYEAAYHGFNIHPYETMFVKSARGVQEKLLAHFTNWTDGSGYRSYDYCDNYKGGLVALS